MKILAPFISCLIEPSDETVNGVSPLDQAMAQGYSQIFILTAEGIFKYHALRPGAGGKKRFICLPVKEVPGLTFPKVSPGVNFLPDGKIPMSLFEEVKEFFRQVITKKGRALEAMIWVLWNETDGYYLHVPNQTVGHASAHYDWGSLPDGSSVIVDIHSHADFSAFFSGTDDRDDSNCIRFSGVVGHNDKPERSMKFRFNYQGVRTEVQLSDLFEHKVTPAAIPEAWMEKVNVNAPSITYGRGSQTNTGYIGGWTGPVNGYGAGSGMSGPYHGRVVRGQAQDDDTGYVPNTRTSHTTGKAHQRELGDAETEGESIPVESRKARKTREKKERAIRNQQAQQAPKQGKNLGSLLTPPALSTKGTELSNESRVQSEEGKGGPEEGVRFLSTPTGLVQIGVSPLEGNIVDGYPSNFRGSWEGDDDDLFGPLTPGNRAMAATAARIMSTTRQEEDLSAQADAFLDEEAQREADPVGGPTRHFSQGQDVSPEFDAIAINHGLPAAIAYNTIDEASADLIASPEVMGRCIEDMFHLIDDDLKLKLFRNLAELLPEKAKDSLAQNGL